MTTIVIIFACVLVSLIGCAFKYAIEADNQIKDMRKKIETLQKRIDEQGGTEDDIR